MIISYSLNLIKILKCLIEIFYYLFILIYIFESLLLILSLVIFLELIYLIIFYLFPILVSVLLILKTKSENKKKLIKINQTIEGEVQSRTY